MKFTLFIVIRSILGNVLRRFTYLHFDNFDSLLLTLNMRCQSVIEQEMYDNGRIFPSVPQINQISHSKVRFLKLFPKLATSPDKLCL